MTPLPLQQRSVAKVDPDELEENPQQESTPRRSWRSRLAFKSRSENVGPTTQWSDGARWRTRAISGGLLLALACGPVALFTGTRGEQEAPFSMAQVEEYSVRMGQREAVAREAATEMVTVWAAATEEDHRALDQLMGGDPGDLPAEATPVREVTAMSATPVAPGTWSVVVTGQVKSGEQWRPMSWKLPVQVAGGGDSEAAASVLALPAPVAAAADVRNPERGSYPVEVPKGPLMQTTESFLGSLLAGQGGMERYTAPSSSIPAIRPAPYKDVEVTQLMAQRLPQGTSLDSPQDGQSIQVSAQVALRDSASKNSPGRPGQYLLTLQARAGRWEVAAIDDFPVNTTTNTTKE